MLNTALTIIPTGIIYGWSQTEKVVITASLISALAAPAISYFLNQRYCDMNTMRGYRLFLYAIPPCMLLNLVTIGCFLNIPSEHKSNIVMTVIATWFFSSFGNAAVGIYHIEKNAGKTDPAEIQD